MSKKNQSSAIKLIFSVIFITIFVGGIFGQINQKDETIAAVKSDKNLIYALRLTPGQDLRLELEKFVKENKIDAAYIITAVGSLQAAKIRLADQSSAAHFVDKFEIVSLVGTLSQNGSHLHISISDSAGKTIGGHLVEGCEIYTTAEIIIGVSKDLIFTRETDAQTTYKELKITKKKKRKQ